MVVVAVEEAQVHEDARDHAFENGDASGVAAHGYVPASGGAGCASGCVRVTQAAGVCEQRECDEAAMVDGDPSTASELGCTDIGYVSHEHVDGDAPECVRGYEPEQRHEPAPELGLEPELARGQPADV